jgi:outer membrane biosynthesis protein TonB
LAEQRRAEELARQQLAEQQRAQQLAEQRRVEEVVRQQLAEQQRAQQLAEQRRAEEVVRQQLAEQQRAQQLAEQRRVEELARQQLAEQQRAQQLASQREAEERAQQAAARQHAEELARRQAGAPGRLAAEAAANPTRAEPGAVGMGQGTGGGAGGGSRSLPGGDFGSRARELLRGIDIAKAVPPAMRAAEQAQQAVRRALADAARRDLPLRMYMDSVRQKIERNAIVSRTQLSSDTVHTDPVVSIAIRSDGSIEDVTILRSSGRPDVDEIVRRIVRLNARYAAFPANVAANYDVIELRRIWTFAGVLRLVEEVR